ncbi:jg16249 [Pararge aegeria aegeria]|uniref:Jg16249 protein n=1 Tax=Pararge aegeria aegeria TaxID=348720 RepID=A0A8S4RVT6_9NEOP|nr:jg16249 [Pararge aegeria aegeria]
MDSRAVKLPPYLPRATPAPHAYSNHGGDNRGNIRDRGHPQGGPQEPQDRGGHTSPDNAPVSEGNVRTPIYSTLPKICLVWKKL